MNVTLFSDQYCCSWLTGGAQDVSRGARFFRRKFFRKQPHHLFPFRNSQFKNLMEVEQQPLPRPRPCDKSQMSSHNLGRGAGFDFAGKRTLFFGEQGRPGLEPETETTEKAILGKKTIKGEWWAELLSRRFAALMEASTCTVATARRQPPPSTNGGHSPHLNRLVSRPAMHHRTTRKTSRLKITYREEDRSAHRQHCCEFSLLPLQTLLDTPPRNFPLHDPPLGHAYFHACP